MWILKHTLKDLILYVGSHQEKYVVGRTDCDLVISGDSSISRSHASLQYSDLGVKVFDHGSSYGTFINEGIDQTEKIQPKQVRLLKDGDRIKFGRLGSEFKLSKLKITTICSTLSVEEREALDQYITLLNGSIVESFTARDNVTHLTMPSITVTLKLIQALANGIPIVNLAFWTKCLESVQSSSPFPIATNYLPQLVDEGILNNEIVSFHPNEQRKTLFSGKTFYFLSKRYAEKYEDIIRACSGRCSGFDKSVRKSLLVQPESIVVQCSSGSSAESQCSQSVDHVSDYIRSKKRRLIPDCEIGLAILYCSMNKHCNPDYNFPAAFAHAVCLEPVKSAILAKDTMDNESSATSISGKRPSQHIEIAESQSSASSYKTANQLESVEYDPPAVVVDDSSGDADDCVIIPQPSTASKRKRPARGQQPNKKIALGVEEVIEVPDRNSRRSKRGSEPTPAPTPKKTALIQPEDIKISASAEQAVKEPKEEYFSFQSTAKRPDKVPIKISASAVEILGSDSEGEGLFGFQQTPAPVVNKPPPPVSKPATEQCTVAVVVAAPEPQVNARKRINAIIDDDSDDNDQRNGDEEEDERSFFAFEKRSKPKQKEPVEQSQPAEMISSFTLKSLNPGNTQAILQKRRNDAALRSNPTPLTANTANSSYQNKSAQLFSVDIKSIDVSFMGWLTRSFDKSLSMRTDEQCVIKMEQEDEIDEKTQEWLKSLQNAFKINVKPMKLDNKSGDLHDVSIGSTNDATTTLNGGKNYKAFVKKQNFVPQLEVIPTRKFIVRIDDD